MISVTSCILFFSCLTSLANAATGNQYSYETHLIYNRVERQILAELRAHCTSLAGCANNELALPPDETQTVELHILTIDTKERETSQAVYYILQNLTERLPRPYISFLRKSVVYFLSSEKGMVSHEE